MRIVKNEGEECILQIEESDGEVFGLPDKLEDIAKKALPLCDQHMEIGLKLKGLMSEKDVTNTYFWLRAEQIIERLVGKKDKDGKMWSLDSKTKTITRKTPEAHRENLAEALKKLLNVEIY